MITVAALCPAPPLLAPELTGQDAVVPELRAACALAVERLASAEPDVIVVAGPAACTAVWPGTGRLDLGGFAAPAAPPAPAAGPALPLSIGLGARLLDQAGYRGPRVLQSVGHDEPAAACLATGERISTIADRVGLLVMADGSACRSPRAPGHLDPRAFAFDAAVERAVRSGDLRALAAVDQTVARELRAAGRPAWQVLAGAMGDGSCDPDVLYAADPFGVAYLVAVLTRPR